MADHDAGPSRIWRCVPLANCATSGSGWQTPAFTLPRGVRDASAFSPIRKRCRGPVSATVASGISRSSPPGFSRCRRSPTWSRIGLSIRTSWRRSHEPTGRPTRQERPPQSKDGQAQRLKTDKSALSPSPSEYSVEVSLPRSPWLDFHFQSPLKAPPAPPPIPAQRDSGHGASELEGDRVVASMPMSLGRSAERIWKLVGPGNDIVLAIAAVALIGLAWCVVLCWYLIWGILLVPCRLIARPRTKAS